MRPLTLGHFASMASLSALFFVSFMLTSFTSAQIACHYCGIEKLCPLPYDVKDILSDGSSSNKKFCNKACMKFDGVAEDSKRVLVRDCAPDDMDKNECEEEKEWFGATGTICYCNAENCNPAGRLRQSVGTVVAAALGLVAVALAAANWQIN